MSMTDIEKALQRWPVSCHALCNILLERMKERDLENGRKIHSLMCSLGHDTVSFGGDHLIRFYAFSKCHAEAVSVFRQVLVPTTYTWNSIIAAYVKFGDGKSAIRMYCRMQREEISPDRVTFSCTLKACSLVGDIGLGKLLYSHLLENRVSMDLAIGNALVDMYAKCGSLEDAQGVFDGLPSKDVVSWGAIIGGHASQGNGPLALECYSRMIHCGAETNDIVLLNVIKACLCSGLIREGRLIHHNVIVDGHDSDVAIGSALVHMFIQTGSPEEAQKVFDNVAVKNVVAWGAILGGYAQQEKGQIVLELYSRMLREDVVPNVVIFLHVLKACGILGAAKEGRLLHHQVLGTAFASDIELAGTVVDMYAKCGELHDAQNVFESLDQKNVITLGALVAGYARQGSCDMIQECLKIAQHHGFQLDDSIFTAILTACCHSGLVEQGCFYFTSMQEEYGIQPKMEQYSCLVYLLGSGGCLVEAEDILQTTSILPDTGVWRSLLTSSRAHGNTVLGGWCLDQVSQLDHLDAAGYVLMLNSYAEAQMFASAEEIGDLRKYSATQKTPGKAYIEVGRQSYEFIVGGKNQPFQAQVDVKVNMLNRIMKGAGFVPLTGLVFSLFHANVDKNSDTD